MAHTHVRGVLAALFVLVVTPLGAQMRPRPPAPAEPLEAPISDTFAAGVPVEISRALAARDWESAERTLATRIESGAGTPELHVLLARIFLLDRKPLNAAIALKKADAIKPLDPPSRFLLVLAYVQLSHGDWARPELERLLRDDPDSATYQYWLGRLDYDAGYYAPAIARFEAALARDPQMMRAHDNLGLCYEAMNEPERAMTSYRQAIRLNRALPRPSPWPFTNLAILLRHQDEVEEAEALLREALAADPSFAPAHYQLGTILESRGRLAEAVTELESSIAANPQYAEPNYALARIYRRQGDGARADAALIRFQELTEAKADARRP